MRKCFMAVTLVAAFLAIAGMYGPAYAASEKVILRIEGMV